MKAKHLLLAAALLFGGCNSGINLLKDRAYFKSFTYTGNDPCFEQSRLNDGEIFNPVLQGAYSDASVCRKDGDYYMVTSTYTFFPGLAVLHSKDLVNWEQVSYALPTERQCLNTSLKSTQGLFPATIRYNRHDGYFYITGTLVGGGGHFIVKAKDPAGEWSDPEWIFGIGGVHPSLFFDDDGTAYLLNQGTPDRVPDYPDFKVIWMQRFNLQTMKGESYLPAEIFPKKNRHGSKHRTFSKLTDIIILPLRKAAVSATVLQVAFTVQANLSDRIPVTKTILYLLSADFLPDARTPLWVRDTRILLTRLTETGMRFFRA